MAMSALIGIERAAGTVDYVFCRVDGYVEALGRTLDDHYNRAKAEQVLALGDVRVLREEIGEQHRIELRVKGWSDFYFRDGNAPFFGPRTVPISAYPEVGRDLHGAEWVYFLGLDGNWWVGNATSRADEVNWNTVALALTLSSDYEH